MKCLVDKITIKEIKGAKTIAQAYHQGLPYVVSKDLDPESLYIISPPDSAVSKEYAEHNNLIRKMVDGKNVGGFFEPNRKVRSVKFMKGSVVSVGYIATLESVAFTGVDLKSFKEGDEFDTLNGIKIVEKYINKETLKASRKKNGMTTVKAIPGLDRHQDTAHFLRSNHAIQPGDRFIVTEKLDGTSFRASLIKRPVNKNWVDKIFDLFGFERKEHLQTTVGSRNVVFLNDNGKNIYMQWKSQLEGLLNPGEAIYGEIVGYDADKILFSRGGVDFTYGCQKGQAKLYIYNIIQNLPNGHRIQLTWEQIVGRCKELGLETVPFLYEGVFIDYRESLNHRVNESSLGLSTLDGSHIREGVCVRVESEGYSKIYKVKSADFYVLEDRFKESNKIDIEESN